jgi:hypothetical protein
MTVRLREVWHTKNPVKTHRLVCTYPGCTTVYTGSGKKVRALMKAHKAQTHKPRRGH